MAARPGTMLRVPRPTHPAARRVLIALAVAASSLAAAAASAVAAELPKALLWSLDCLDPGQPVLRTDVPAGSYSDRIVAARFSVPQNWPVQLLTLRTNAVAESWSNRYGGRILFPHIRISAVQA